MTSAPALGPESWQLTDLLDRAPGLHVLAGTLADLVDEGHPLVVGTADLKYSNGLVRFQERHPGRYVQFGISEQHMVSAAAGLAATGLQPYVATFASFLALLACEQIRTDTAYTRLPVRLIGHHAGITLGFYGTSHHATEDLAITRSIAGLTVIAPADAAQLGSALRAATACPGPVYFRIGRGQDPDVYREGDPRFEIGKAIEHGRGDDLTIVATGSMVHPALGAAAKLNAAGVSAGVLDMHTVKPLDETAVLDAARRSGLLLTVEEHSVLGGLGGAVAETVAGAGLGARVVRHGIADEYALIGPPTHLYRHYGLDAEGIEAAALRALGR
ncbi:MULTISPECIES: transketolase family protein [Actinomadura]|uniref:Transketolase n=1 Tax=Actinomadura madurae TaxID=1993 RepID=A0A1I5PEF9_9ACTN|nr:transketolase C-terminal domain-containing protein [Actinomadura madurae]SFP32287.1 transketolase [Actinomadura madurae]SPT63900.1 1-deoxy-D-xylulose-5-phosphate synthase [Actinomadura madurae]